MKKFTAYILITFACISLSAQTTETSRLIDSIYLIKSDSLDCSASIYWRIVAKGKEAIPYLFEKLLDSTTTKVQHPCKMKTLSVGDIAFLALNQIADFPAFVVLQI